MRKWNEDFYHDWKNMDDLSFHTAINRLPEDVRKYGDCRFMSDAMYKIWKSEDVTISAEEILDLEAEAAEEFPTKNREKARKKHHEKVGTEDRMKAVEPLTDRVRLTRNGGVKKREKSSVRAYFKQYDRRIRRHENKKIPVESTVPPFDPWEELELEHFDYEEFYEVDSDGNHIWKKAEDLYKICPYWEDEYVEDEASPVGVVEPDDKLQAQVDSLKNQVQNLTNEINRLNSFLQEFNLNKLYEQFLLDKGHEFF